MRVRVASEGMRVLALDPKASRNREQSDRLLAVLASFGGEYCASGNNEDLPAADR